MLLLFPPTSASPQSLTWTSSHFPSICAPTNWLLDSKQEKFSFLIFSLLRYSHKESEKAATPSAGQKSSVPAEKERRKAWAMPGSERRGPFAWKSSASLSFTGRWERQHRLDHLPWGETWKPPVKVGAQQCSQPYTSHWSLSKTQSCIWEVNWHPLEDLCISGQHILYLSNGALQRWYKSKFKFRIHKTHEGKSSIPANTSFEWVKPLLFG